MEQQNKYRVIVSERATQMLISHAAFLAQVSPEAAEQLTAEFEKTANSLELMPQRCPWLTGEYDNLPDSRRYSLRRLCGGLQAGLQLAYPVTREQTEQNCHFHGLTLG